ncbi:MAG: transposase [Thermomicrobiales bacterium]|nr:transposase [Thermomicrobiales bacterium]
MSDTNPLGRKPLRHRLPAPSYATYGSTWHVTIGIQDRNLRVFENADLAQAILDTFRSRIDFYRARLHLCCLMPDHCHLIIQVTDRGLVEVVRDLKSVTTRVAWKHGVTGKLWQESFHDHGIREAEDFDALVAYILNNPVRAGLVDTWENYPYIAGEFINQA